MALLSDPSRVSFPAYAPRSPDVPSTAPLSTLWELGRRHRALRMTFACNGASPSEFSSSAVKPGDRYSPLFLEVFCPGERQNSGCQRSSLSQPATPVFQDPRTVLQSYVNCDECVLLLSDTARVLPRSKPSRIELSPSENGQAPWLPQQNGSSLSTTKEDLSIEEISVLKENDELWLKMRMEARQDAEREPMLASYLYSTILAHRSLERALAFHLGNKLCSSTLLATQLYNLFVDIYMSDAHIRKAMRADIRAVKERDPACSSYTHCMLNFKGFLATQTHRIAHKLWKQGRERLAQALQSRMSEVFTVDIHPAAELGNGLLLDHATGVVIGETAIVGDNVSILHGVTLGGTGKQGGDRHPKIGNGVLIGAGASILGNIRIGDGAKIGAGSVVLKDVPPKATAVGSPARLLGVKTSTTKSEEPPPAFTMDHTIGDWSDYVI